MSNIIKLFEKFTGGYYHYANCEINDKENSKNGTALIVADSIGYEDAV